MKVSLIFKLNGIFGFDCGLSFVGDGVLGLYWWMRMSRSGERLDWSEDLVLRRIEG